jgi:hypothetical protein
MENKTRDLIKTFVFDPAFDMNALMDCLVWVNQNYLNADFSICTLTNKDGTEDSGSLQEIFPVAINNFTNLLTLSVVFQSNSNSNSFSILLNFGQSVYGPNGNMGVMYDDYQVQLAIADHVYKALHLRDLDIMRLATEYSGPITTKSVFKQWKFDLFKNYILLLIPETTADFQYLFSTISSVAKQNNLSVIESKTLFGTEYLENLWCAINEAKLIIITLESDPLFYYLLGIIHTLGKKSILLVSSETKVPFDLIKFGKIVLSDKTSEDDATKTNLENAIQESLLL